MSLAHRIGLVAIAAFSLQCGGDSIKRLGQPCVASSECESGLICDQGTRTCASMGSPVDAPVGSDAPMGDAPLVDAPLVDAPMIDAPMIDAPMIDAPMIDAPMIDAPMIDAPMIDAPVIDAPMIDAPMIDAV